MFGWLVGFLTSSSTTRLYRGGSKEKDKEESEKNQGREIERDKQKKTDR